MLQVTSTASSFPATAFVPREIRALLLDDSNFDRARIRRLSRKTDLLIHMDEVESIDQMGQAVAQETYDLILIDYRLPIGDGLQALDIIQQNEQSRDAGKIMVTCNAAHRTVVEAMRGGCHDFLNKEDISVDALRKAIVNALEAAQKQQRADLQAEQQKEIIRQGLVAAMQDQEVQGNVISIVQKQLRQAGCPQDDLEGARRLSDLETLLASFDREETFTFH